MLRNSIPICVMLALLMPAAVIADDLTKMIQMDLIALGYDPGNIQGELSTETIVAISKFQAENNMDITGEPSPQLAGVIKARINEKNKPGGAVASTPAADGSQQVDTATLQAAQQQCLQDKIAAKQESQKKKKGFGSLMRAVTNTASRYGGGSDLARQVTETSYDIYKADATAKDWERAAEDLGLTEDELEECQNPSMQGAGR